jgi:hypothetical protein
MSNEGLDDRLVRKVTQSQNDRGLQKQEEVRQEQAKKRRG